ncbi:MAG: hypothetical protein AAF468_17930 [Pseudomonadota bacterium]
MSSLKERLTISVDPSVKDGLEKQVPKNGRSAFAEQAIIDALDRLARKRAIEALHAIEPAPNPEKVRSEDLLRQWRNDRGDRAAK